MSNLDYGCLRQRCGIKLSRMQVSSIAFTPLRFSLLFFLAEAITTSCSAAIFFIFSSYEETMRLCYSARALLPVSSTSERFTISMSIGFSICSISPSLLVKILSLVAICIYRWGFPCLNVKITFIS